MPEGYFFYICTPTRLLQMFMIIFLKSVTRFESGLMGWGGMGWGGGVFIADCLIYTCVSLSLSMSSSSNMPGKSGVA